MRWTPYVFGLGVCAAHLSGCQPKPCDEGDIYRGGVCFPAPPKPLADAGSADASPPAKPTDASAEDASVSYGYAGFGDKCTDGVSHTDCTLDANYCGKTTPDQAMGNCTIIDCLDDVNVCPTDWTCCNIRAVLASSPVESVCLNQAAVPEALAPQCKR